MAVFRAVTAAGVTHDFTAEAMFVNAEGAVEFYDDNGLAHVVAPGVYLYVERQP